VFSPETYPFAIESLPRRRPGAFAGAGRARAVLGIGALTHDTSAALVCRESGTVLYASPEERLSNVKHDSHFPIGSVLRCCDIAMRQDYVIESVAVNFDPALYLPGVIANEPALQQLDPCLRAEFLDGLRQVARTGEPFDLARASACRTRVQDLLVGLHIASDADRAALALRLTWYLNVAVKYRRLGTMIERLFEGVPVRFIAHHDAHAASAFFGSGLDETAILVIDGHGELDTTTIYRGDAGGMARLAQTPWPHSLGSVFLAITRYLGFEYGDEYKVMGMSAYGQPRYVQELSDAVTATADGRVHIAETRNFGIRQVRNSGQLRFTVLDDFSRLCPRREPSDAIAQAHFDLAASVQALVQHTGVQLARAACRLAGTPQLAIAGGVGLNGLMNDAIRRGGAASDLFIYPAASDDGTSTGAALALVLESGVRPAARMQGCYYGYSAAASEIDSALQASGARFSTPQSIHRCIAQAVAEGKIVARYTGAAEFGPRALGHRSILANPALPEMKDVLNVRVKHREQFRPFAPACLREHVGEWFDIDGDAPFMILIVHAREAARQRIPAVVHNDGTARVQTVTAEDHADFHATLREFHAITGIPVMVNTSFNVNGEAIVDTPVDALESFAFMDIDFLALGDHWIAKSDNPELLGAVSHEEYLLIRKKRYSEQVAEPLTALDVRQYQPWFYPAAVDLKEFSGSATVIGKAATQEAT
jgi:carbamoyltransferase